MDWISASLPPLPLRIAVAGLVRMWTLGDPAEKAPVAFGVPTLVVRSLN